MAFTGQDIMGSVAVRAHKDVSTAGSDDDSDVKEWTKQAILHVQKADDWRCHKAAWSLTTATTPALAAGTYAYNLRTLLSNFRKLQGDSVRYGAHRVEWKETPEQIDRTLGPAWKDGTESGGPDLCTMMGPNLWLAPNPSASWIADYGTAGVAGYYYAGEDVTSADWEDVDLLFPDDFYIDLVNVAMIYALQTEDDSAFQVLLSQWEQAGLTRLRGYDDVPLGREPVRVPRWARGRIA